MITAAAMLQAQAFLGAIEEIAEDVGRLRRRLADDEYGSFVVDRLSLRIDGLDSFLRPTAAELYAHGYDIDDALEQVDARAQHLRALLAEPRR